MTNSHQATKPPSHQVETKSPQSTVHSPQWTTKNNSPVVSHRLDLSPSKSLLGTRDQELARGGGLRRAFQLIILLITIAAFTAAFFPHAQSLASPTLLDLVQRYNVDNPIVELTANLRLSMPKDPQAFITSLADRLGCGDPITTTSASGTRLTATSPQGFTTSIRIHPVANLWLSQAELQISLADVHPGIVADLERQLRTIAKQLRPGDKTPVLVTVSGTLPPERIERSEKDLINSAFVALGAKISEGVSEAHLESWSGYTPRLPDAIKVSKNNLNLQIATRYATDENAVIIKIGTPLIVGTY